MLCRFCPPDGAVRGVRVVTGVERGTKGPAIENGRGGLQNGRGVGDGGVGGGKLSFTPTKKRARVCAILEGGHKQF